MAATTITFEGYSLQDATFRSRIIQHTDSPARIIQSESKARADGMTIVNTKYVNRVIEVEGRINADDRADLVAKIDELKLNLDGVSGQLKIGYGDDQRLYFATVERIELPEDFYNINFVDYKVVFFCADPFGYATASGVVSLTGQTAALKDVIITVSGSVQTEPVLHFTVNSATGMQLLTFSNENTGENIVINKPDGSDFSASDEIIINAKRKEVQINSSGIDYTGRFPTIAPATTTLRVEIQATAVDYDLTYRYLPAFL